ncbi:hypothetical protein Lser_V15G32954 [Lactuca serriola]
MKSLGATTHLNFSGTCPIGCFWMCEDSDDEKPFSSKYNSKSKVGSSNNHKPVVPKVHQNGSASKDNTQLKNIGLNKRPPDEERSASVKKPKLSDTVTLVNHKPTRLQAQAAGVAYSHPMTNLTSRMAVFGPNMVYCFEYKGTLDVFYKIIRQEGFGRLWRGTNAGLALAIPTVGIYLPCYDIFRNWFEEFAVENAPSMTPCSIINSSGDNGWRSCRLSVLAQKFSVVCMNWQTRVGIQ